MRVEQGRAGRRGRTVRSKRPGCGGHLPARDECHRSIVCMRSAMFLLAPLTSAADNHDPIHARTSRTIMSESENVNWTGQSYESYELPIDIYPMHYSIMIIIRIRQ